MNTSEPNPLSSLPAIVILLCTLALSLAFVVASEPGEPISDHEHYCQMVQIHIETEGKHGWPDYNRNYEKICHGKSR